MTARLKYYLVMGGAAVAVPFKEWRRYNNFLTQKTPYSGGYKGDTIKIGGAADE